MFVTTIVHDLEAAEGAVAKFLKGKPAQEVEHILFKFSGEIGLTNFIKAEYPKIEATVLKTAQGVLNNPATAGNVESVLVNAVKQIFTDYETQLAGNLAHGHWLYFLANAAWSEIKTSGILGDLLKTAVIAAI